MALGCAALEGDCATVRDAALLQRGGGGGCRSEDLDKTLVAIPINENTPFEEVDLFCSQGVKNLDLEAGEKSRGEGIGDVRTDESSTTIALEGSARLPEVWV